MPQFGITHHDGPKIAIVNDTLMLPRKQV